MNVFDAGCSKFSLVSTRSFRLALFPHVLQVGVCISFVSSLWLACCLCWRLQYSDDYGTSYENLVGLPALKDFVLSQIEVYTRLALDSFERPKAIYLIPHEVALPIGEGLKHKQNSLGAFRSQLAEAYAKPIKEMYATLANDFQGR